MANGKGSIGAGIFWMFLITILLFWLPVAGPLIAGFVGGRKAGGLGNAIIAVFLPGIILGFCLFLMATLLTGMPLIGAVAGAGAIALVATQVGPLLLGAIVGGLMA